MTRQYREMKRQYPDAVLFFRMGDFFETFGEDAVKTSKALDIVLTSRNRGSPQETKLAGFPHHALDNYIGRMLRAGHKVAVCEQLEDPKKAKGLVKRGVIRVYTPGTLMEGFLLDEKENNFLAAVSAGGGSYGLAVIDISTGEFMATQFDGDDAAAELNAELVRLGPAEVLVPEWLCQDEAFVRLVRVPSVMRLSEFPDVHFAFERAYDIVRDHFGTLTLDGFGLEDRRLAVSSAGAALVYIRETFKGTGEHIRALHPYSTDDVLVIDAVSSRNLELVRSIRSNDSTNTLLEVLDHTTTPMGGRLLRRWLLRPLTDVTAIERRLDTVSELVEQQLVRDDLRDLFRGIADLERLATRIVSGTANARDLVSLRDSLLTLPRIREQLAGRSAALLAEAGEALPDLADVADLIARAIVDAPPTAVREGGIIRGGFDADLDEIRSLSRSGKDWIATMQETERERTGIRSLRVGFNKVFGYYIEVTRANLELVPDDYIRKQTLANAERFITEELKVYESKVLTAEERSVALEYELFCRVRSQVAERAADVQDAAQVLARIDVLACLAQVAHDRGYKRPQVNDGDRVRILAGRHPVVERTIGRGGFIPNDTTLDCGENRFLLITGPNMAGKSTYLRQVALVVLMAQMGSFVPALEAVIGVVDRIFTRVGAHDDLASGQSTFMVEMNETSNILHNASSRSLVLLDEIGRGTSTFDGLSIAWAVTEYLHSHPEKGCKTLFATHYHQLTVLEDELAGLRNLSIAIKDDGGRLVFLRKMVDGPADRSYGIEVAQLAGFPEEVLDRARQVLGTLEDPDHPGSQALAIGPLARPPPRAPQAPAEEPEPRPKQASLVEFTSGATVLDELSDLDLNEMTPVQALNKLEELKRQAQGGGGDD